MQLEVLNVVASAPPSRLGALVRLGAREALNEIEVEGAYPNPSFESSFDDVYMRKVTSTLSVVVGFNALTEVLLEDDRLRVGNVEPAGFLRDRKQFLRSTASESTFVVCTTTAVFVWRRGSLVERHSIEADQFIELTEEEAHVEAVSSHGRIVRVSLI